eukprot:GFUD01032362.1.p1 GENE.GFUD01032362.1~~GFUD01032362.1.p1  ORF type:complete len:354 (-),score=83.18 GFUD01032362.1:67-1128(-)
MSSGWREESACKQVLTAVKRSNLHYVMKETAFSVQISIKKMFLKSSQTFSTENETFRIINKEDFYLRQKIRSLESELKQSKIEFESLKTKNEMQGKQKVAIESQLETVLRENEQQKIRNDKTANSKLDLKMELSKLLKENENLEQRNIIEKEKLKEKCDLVAILENTLMNKDLELKTIHDDFELENTAVNMRSSKRKHSNSQLSCLNYEFKISKDEHRNKENDTLHKDYCEDCDQRFETKANEEKHLCKIVLKNPSFETMYLKNFLLTKQCSPILSLENRKEFAILHCDNCWNFTSFCEKLPSWFFGEPLRDKYGILHLKMTDFVKNGEVNWDGINLEIIETIYLTCYNNINE